jgi:UDP-N-acetylmuramyl pentapeptide phosphotransferase/UDP-N-acetylglucosamine-1-phosphate transferase
LTIAYVSPFVAAIVTLLLVAWMLKAGARLPLDLPNERSLHQRPVPRSGGLAIMAGVLAGFAILQVPLIIVLPATMLVVVSHFDDLRGLPIAARFGAHFAAAIWFVCGALPALPWLLLVPIVIGIVWVTNLYNFMDGSDGLAGGMTLAGFGCLAIGAGLSGDEALMIAGIVAAAAGAAFLLFNFPPARIFMGDAGSVPLGFLAVAFSLAGWRDGDWPFWFPAVAFAPFVADATLTLLKRMLRRERFWEAHRTHYYQRLVQMGWGHRGTAFAEYALMLLSGATALWAVGQPLYLQFAAVLALIGLYAALALRVDLAWRRHLQKHND